MCGRYSVVMDVDRLRAAFAPFDLRLDAGLLRENIAPTQQVLTVVAPDGRPQAEAMRWGLVPPWAKDLKGSARMFNARLETVTERPAFRSLIPKGTRRALVVADGWYEWLSAEQRGQPKQPFRFQVDGGAPFAFAGLWTPARIDGEWLRSVTLLTCDSSLNPVAAAIHDRMPVVLTGPQAYRAWLDSALGTEVLELCGALPAERLSASPANPARINKVR